MYYFASDMHLGLIGCEDNRMREMRIVRWLDKVATDASAIYLMGDVFDFWFEYHRVIPKGYVRLLGKLAELTDRGVEIHFFTGNHDMWVYDYLQKECGVIIHTKPEIVELCGKRVFLAHGDGFGKSTTMFKIMNSIFHSRTARKIFSAVVHPNLTMKLGHWWSSASRKGKALSHNFRDEQEPLIIYSKKLATEQKIDYFIYGHTHCALKYALEQGSEAVFLGEWIVSPTYAELSEQGIKLMEFK